jgi:hypothetical protein
MTETFQISSKSFTVKWIDVPLGSKVSWKLRPLKNSINLGIYQHKIESTSTNSNDTNNNNSKLPGQKSSLIEGYSSSSTASNVSLSDKNLSSNLLENLNLNEVNEIPHRFFTQLPNSPNSIQTVNNVSLNKKPSNGGNLRTNANNSDNCLLEEKLDKHLIKKSWIGKCPADSLKAGSFQIENGGLYAFVFDNTFSKTKAKTILFEYKITSSQTVDNENNNQNNLKNQTVEFDVLKGTPTYGENTTSVININGVQYLEGSLMKKRRKKSGKNFVKRFFSLNLTYSILHYYSSENSNRIRGMMMIKQTVISADSAGKMLYLDSGMEQWILKANSLKDFNTWVNAFNFVKTQNKKMQENLNTPQISISHMLSKDSTPINDDDEDDEKYDYQDFVDASERLINHSGGSKVNPQFQIVENRIKQLKETVSELIEKEKSDEFKSKGKSIRQSSSISDISSGSKMHAQQQSVMGSTRNRRPSRSLTLDQFNSQATQTNMPTKKSSFLQRLKKKETQSAPSTPNQQSFELERSSKLITGNQSFEEASNNSYNSRSNSVSSVSSSPIIEQVSARSLSTTKITLNSILEKINELESEYSDLVRQESGNVVSQLRIPLTRSSTQAKSILSQEFFDAQEFADETEIGVVMLNNESSEDIIEEVKQSQLSSNIFEQTLEQGNYQLEASSSDEDEDLDDEQLFNTVSDEELIETDIFPLPYTGKFTPRQDIKPAACEPPSLISILRKGIGKDISNMSMPITTNEPLSFLQKYTETLEYSKMINEAMNTPNETGERILKIAAFAITFLSSYKDKVRSIRKPFNPLLGETFELVRPDLDVRVITEKVVHKPFVMAAHIDSTNWYIDHTLSPQQKFYGKTAEISVDGTLKLRFRNCNEIYEWNQPTTILRNIVSLTGEKYTEPTENITIKSNTGFKCIVTFVPENGRFSSSRSEKVTLEVYSDKKGSKPLPLKANGSWTSEIVLNNGKSIWKIAPQLGNHEKKYGFTKFACSLNHLDEIHQNSAPTDSRRRPDQKLYENGEIDRADELKLKLEEDQRLRRKDPNGDDVVHVPKFFEKGENDLDWKFKKGPKGYWNRRKTGNWDDVVRIW